MKFDRLTKEQKEFIKDKIRGLGSMEAVIQFYRPNPKSSDQTLSLVDEYAHHIAREVLR